MAFLQNIAISSLLLILASSCSMKAKKKNPYRPSGKTKVQVKNENKIEMRERTVRFLRERYNLCTHKRALRSARYKYRSIINQEKKYGNPLTEEKNKYKKMIIEIGKRTKRAEQKFSKRFKRPLYCSPQEMRHLNL